MSPRAAIALVLFTGALVYVADRLTKQWALANLIPGEQRPWLGRTLQLHLIFNPGAAFSLGTSTTWLFTLIQAAVAVAILLVMWRLRSRAWAVGAGLALGGASGNLTDRLTRAPGFGVGHVVDFLELPHWPIFNVADSAIVSAAVLVAAATVFGVGPTDPAGARRADAAPGPAAADRAAADHTAGHADLDEAAPDGAGVDGGAHAPGAASAPRAADGTGERRA